MERILSLLKGDVLRRRMTTIADWLEAVGEGAWSACLGH